MDSGIGAIFGTLIGSLLGFLASVLPEYFKLLQVRLEHARNIETRAQEIEAASKGIDIARDSNTTRTTSGGQVIVSSDSTTTTTKPIEKLQIDAEEDAPITNEGWGFLLLRFLRASVRPVVTYTFFGVFVFIKLFSFYFALTHENVSVLLMLPILWDDGTQALFAAVLSFWFGSRALGANTASFVIGKK